MNNMLELNYDKTLKLTHPLVYEMVPRADLNLDLEITRMENYIKAKGSQPIGPLIQYTAPKTRDNGSVAITIKLLRQASSYISDVALPYTMEYRMRVPDCLYVRFIGEESKIKVAYEKISVAAFEGNIELRGDSYTIFVDRKEESIIADIFMQRK